MSGNEQLEKLKRGTVTVEREDELAARLAAGRPLRVKLGLDPTAPDIHLGHTIPLRKLRQFQDLGHKAVLIIGDYTARIGDPSGRSRTRPPLTEAAIESNLATYVEQAGKILDPDPERLEVVRNGQWLAGLSFADILRLAAQATVAQLLAREDFHQRYQANTPIGVHELLYPLMQAYDSVQVEADVELGGTDQTFNLLLGRELQRQSGQAPQVIMTFPILVGLDGKERMSKSLGNYVGVAEPPKEQYGKVMSLPDEPMRDYYLLLTDRPAAEIDRLLAGHPRRAKAELAAAIVAQFHGPAAAESTAAEFDRLFRDKGQAPDRENQVEIRLTEEKIWVVNAIKQAGFADSSSGVRSLIAQGAVSSGQIGVPIRDYEPITDVNHEFRLEPGEDKMIKVGKKGRFIRLTRPATDGGEKP